MYSEHVHIMDHPLVAHKLSILRDKNTSTMISAKLCPRSAC